MHGRLRAPLAHDLPERLRTATVLHRQDPVSWNREVLFPTIVIIQGQGEAFHEVVLSWAGAQKVLRELQGLVTEIREKQTWHA